jgi:hypothetical protein
MSRSVSPERTTRPSTSTGWPTLSRISPLSCDQKKDQQCQRSKLLKRELRQTVVAGVAHQQADHGVQISEAVKLHQRKDPVSQPQQEHGHTEMTPVVKQGEEAAIQTTKRPNRKNDVQQQKPSRPQPADHERLNRRMGMNPTPNPAKSAKYVSTESPNTEL